MYLTKAAARLTLSLLLMAVAVPLAAQDRIPWITDLEQARQLAERQNRLVLLHFWSESCGPCRRLESGVFNQPEFIRALTTGYIPVKINADQQPRLITFYNIESVPTDVIVTPEGREIQRFTSKQDSNAYIAMLDGIRARAGVGAYAQASSSRGIPTGQPNAQPAYNGPANASMNAYPFRGAQGANQYSNPLPQDASPQMANVAPRYSNPYAAEQPGTPVDGSRWGQQDQSRYGDTAPQGQGPGLSGSQYQAPTQTTSANPSYNTQPQQNQYAANQPPRQNGYDATSGPAMAQDNQYSQNPNLQNSAPSNATLPSYQPGAGTNYQPAATAVQPASRPEAAQPQPSIALEGYCPVTLIENRFWQAGDKRWGAVHEGHIYLFAGQQQQQQFLKNPQRYAPLMAGNDPVRYAETGQLVPGKREFGLYVEDPGPIALFADEAALLRFEQNAGYYYDMLRQASAQQSQQRR